MSNQVLARVACRSGTAAQWAATTEILAQGEFGWDSTNKILKVGDGTSLWALLTTAATWSPSATLDSIDDTATYVKIQKTPGDLVNAMNVTTLVNQATIASQGKVQLVDDGTNDAMVVQDHDSRLTDARTPTSHATTHATGGTDALAPSDIGAATASDITSAVTSHNGTSLSVHGITDTSALVVTTDPRLTDDRDPNAHATSHKRTGTDELKLSELGEVWLDQSGTDPPSNGQVLTFDGTYWENQDNPAVAHAATTSIHVTDSSTLARQPNTTVGASGEFKLISAGLGAALNAPAGGNWAYFICCFNGSGALNLTTPFAAGVVAGGTEIGAATSSYKWTGFAYKK